MDYSFRPISAKKRPFLIEPCHLISMEDLAIMFKSDSIYSIAEAISNRWLTVYFHKSTSYHENKAKMLCYPMQIYTDYEFEYYFVRHRFFFLKRDVQNCITTHPLVFMPDKVLEVPEERVATKDNVSDITRKTILRSCIHSEYHTTTYFDKFMRVPLFFIFLMILAVRISISFSKSFWSTYSYKGLTRYNGETLKSFDYKDAEIYVKNAKDNNKSFSGEERLKWTDLRGLLAVELLDAGVTRNEIGQLLHHNGGVDLDPDDLKKTVSDWLKHGKEFREKCENKLSPQLSDMEEKKTVQR